MNVKNKRFIASALILAVVATSNAAASAEDPVTNTTQATEVASGSMYLSATNQPDSADMYDTVSGVVQDSFVSAIMSPDRQASAINRKTVVKREFYAEITGYSSTVDQTDDSPFIAADGTHVYDGMVAANFLPFGTRVKIDGFGEKVFTVHDRMNKRFSERMDIWFSDRTPALKFGKRVLKVQILES